MLRADIADTLGEIWNDGPVAAQEQFAVDMEGRQYGREALVSAWLWFLHGWYGAGGELAAGDAADAEREKS